jgi:shikimate dehydrogenase
MKFGLIGFALTHSYSQAYFTKRFRDEGFVTFRYDNYELNAIDEVRSLLQSDLFGFNVTIPYKTSIIPWLNQIDRNAFELQAVNTVVRTGQYSWKGFNTDVYGFKTSLTQWISERVMPERALVLGTGGGGKAVRYVLEQLGVRVSQVSRKGDAAYTYASLDRQVMQSHKLIINTTPLGMSPHVDALPELPYEFLTTEHYLYDLIYNPANTLFLTRGQQAGAMTKNGLDMLHLQADQAWAIWKKYGKF